MKYDERTCKFNMDTGCVELLLRDGRKISIDCTGVEDALDVTMAQRSELDYLIYNDPLGYADLILNGDPKEYLKNVTEEPWLRRLRIAKQGVSLFMGCALFFYACFFCASANIRAISVPDSCIPRFIHSCTQPYSI